MRYSAASHPAKARRRAWWASAAGAVLAIGLLFCLAATAAAQEDVAATAAGTTTQGAAGSKIAAPSCGSPATFHLCVLVRSASYGAQACGKSRGILLPQLANDVLELASRNSIAIRRSHLTVEVQPLFDTRVSTAAAAVHHP
jgi:hypothetical protein